MKIIFLLAALSTLIYFCWHLWRLLPCANAYRFVFVTIALLLSVSFLLLNRTIDVLPITWASVAYNISTSAPIVVFYSSLVFLLLDLGRSMGIVPASWLRNNFYTLGVIALFLFGVFSWGNWRYSHKYKRELTLSSHGKLSRPIKVLMMSDLQLGYHIRRSELAQWVDSINAENPDLVLIAGDLMDRSIRPLHEENMALELKRIHAPIFACLGNHEYYTGDKEAAKFIREAGITLLKDSAMRWGEICIVGRDDYFNPRRASLKTLMPSDKGLYTIVLDHQPHLLKEAEHCGADFQLSGHTHEGQIWPISWITHAIYECAYGSHQRGKTQYYISSGMGIWGGKFRIGTRSEYVVATIVP